MRQKLPYEGTWIDIPPVVAVCPYCQGKLSAHVNAWEEPDTGEIWDVTEIELECENEDVDDPEDHTYMPYVYWLPVECVVRRWMNRAENKERAIQS